MSDPFFAAPKTRNKSFGGDKGAKRKRPGAPNNFNQSKRSGAPATNNKKSGKKSGPVPKKHVEKLALEEELSEGGSDSSEKDDSGDESDESIKESAEEKRLRIAKQYIQNLRDGLPEDELEVDARDIDRDIIAERLQKDALETTKRLYYKIVDQLPSVSDISTQLKKMRNQEVTALVLDVVGGFVYTGNKRGDICQWSLSDLTKTHTFPGTIKKDAKFQGHIDHVFCLALSHDGKYLASGGRDNRINIWDLGTLSFKGIFKQHKDSISGLAFRRGSYDLYSCSFDRTIKVWNAEELSYIETLFGHQDMIMDIACLDQEHCVTVGSRDATLRLWKIAEQTQLVFRGGSTTKYTSISEATKESKPLHFVEGSVDKVAMLDESNFVTGGDSGSLCLWHTSKKKPTDIYPVAHGLFSSNGQPCEITALASIPYTDLIISGSCDGNLKFWKVGFGSKRSISPLFSIPLAGFINSISVSTKDPNHHQAVLKKGEPPVYYVLVSLSRQPIHGRWNTIEGVKDGFVKIEIPLQGLPKSCGSS
ncbi:pre-rRNA processing protein [Entomophthora muscae]|uniref:Pre-rRNA processing protein n=1 Tax=Entomophthora muscae TaxID=34485 RepID=A0ACC2UQD5_9FUNG|nr:pre-rRNA processing protein [Entomophthora muscae]